MQLLHPSSIVKLSKLFCTYCCFCAKCYCSILFPFIGHTIGLSQETFCNWAAIAIHDTSSVVGAGAIYGEQALQIATTVKLIRALWIIPLSFVIAFLYKTEDKQSIKISLVYSIIRVCHPIC